MNKLDLKKVIEAMRPAKELKKEVKVTDKIEPKGVRVRDMRQESMDLGSHGAKEIFGEASQNE